MLAFYCCAFFTCNDSLPFVTKVIFWNADIKNFCRTLMRLPLVENPSPLTLTPVTERRPHLIIAVMALPQVARVPSPRHWPDGLPHLDTGKLYRATGLSVVRAGADPADAALGCPGRLATLDPHLLDDPELMTSSTAEAASIVSAHPGCACGTS